MDATTTGNVPFATIMDEILGNAGGNTARIRIDRLAALIAALMGPTYATRAQLYADLGWPSGSVGYVRADPNTALNGVYKKAGASGSGSWSRIGDLPTGAIELALIDAVNSNGVKFYNSPAEQGQAAGIQRIFTLENWGVAVRARNTTEDALFGTVPYWGISRRLTTIEHVEEMLAPIVNAIRAAGRITLTNIGGSGDAITASLDSVTSLNATVVANTMRMAYRPLLSNLNANPSITIGGTTYGVRDADGGTWPAGGFVTTGREYDLARYGSIIRVVSETLRAELATQRADQITLSALGDTFTLANVAGTANLITATLDASVLARGIGPGNIRRFNCVPLYNNTGATKVDFGAGEIELRSRTGQQLSANAIVAGEMFAAVKVNSRFHMVQDATARDIGVLRTQLGTIMRDDSVIWLTSLVGTASEHFGSVGLSLAPIITSNFYKSRFAYSPQIVSQKAENGETYLTIDGSRRQIADSANASIPNGFMRPGHVYILTEHSQFRWIILYSWAPQQSLDTATARLATLETESMGLIKQVNGTIPARPKPVNVGQYMWKVFSAPPASAMGPDDLVYLLPTPQEPNVPPDGSYDFRSVRDGGNGVLRIGSVRVDRPEVEGIAVSIDGAAPIILPPLAGDYIIPMAAGARAVTFAYRNFVGDSLTTLPIVRTIASNHVTWDFPVNMLLEPNRKDDWLLLYQAGNAGNRSLRNSGGMLIPSHDNSATRLMSREYYSTNQFIEADIGAFYPTLNGQEGIGLGINGNATTGAGIQAIFHANGVRLYRASGPDTYSLLKSEALAIPAGVRARIERPTTETVQAKIDGDVVLTYDLTQSASALALTGGGVQIYARSPNITDSRLQLRFLPIRAGDL